ncbi:hypothetical protein HS1genome_1103 [Sulfodiicoccus acidiphilus]|uniref:Uncharacterized protein n=1 Tax=Sulfodiicoccus acidiphilus TaxID=1670455 RepID=A0A348B3G2_9CREN|nr:hypothetical protein [Sulfodiicoccus acidiphilus]BBD72714.1 hypothetical protein HS1genome_1103 [Sulfodiicoccus acidiphilus]GGT95342.1 hypothetical protein GCM10007116_11040 [Sulfodiicoccus acidiphilus]
MELLLENSKSKSGKHAARALALEVRQDSLVEVNAQGKKAKPTYSVGEAMTIDVSKVRGTVVYMRFVRNLKKKVEGEVVVIRENNVLLKMKYRKLKLKRVEGDSSYVELVKRAMEQLKVPVKKVNGG